MRIVWTYSEIDWGTKLAKLVILGERTIGRAQDLGKRVGSPDRAAAAEQQVTPIDQWGRSGIAAGAS